MNPSRYLSGCEPRGRIPHPRDPIPARTLARVLFATLLLQPAQSCAAVDPAVPSPDASEPAALRPADGDGCGPVDFAGCCDGETVLWCEDDRIRSLDCGARPRCGWRPASGYHDCHTGGGEDPDGLHPRDCPWIAHAAPDRDP